MQKQELAPSYALMFSAMFKALNDVTSPELRSVLWRSIALSIVLFAALWIGLEFLLSAMTIFPWPWATTALQITTGIGLLGAFFFLMAPVTAFFAGLFSDGICAKVEARHYPLDVAGRSPTIITGLWVALRFGAIALCVYLVVFPLVLLAGFGVILILIANAYLISREYFEMAASRFMPVKDAAALRHANAGKVFFSGLIPGILAMVPFVNFVTPVFATAYFLHYFKQAKASWA